MKRIIFVPIFILIFLSQISFAQEAGVINVQLTNGTAPGQTVTAEEVVLAKLKMGMDVIATQDDVTGTCQFTGLAVEDTYLLQVTYQDVVYNQQVEFGDASTVDVTVPVYEISSDWPEAMTLQIPHTIIRLIDESTLQIDQRYLIDNQGNTTYLTADGSLRFGVPNGAKIQNVTAQSGSVPVAAFTESQEDGSEIVDYPFRPGETQINVRMEIPYTGTYEFSQQFYHDVAGEIPFLFSPLDLDVASDQLTFVQEDAGGNLQLFRMDDLSAGDGVEFTVSGGTLDATNTPGTANQERQHGQVFVRNHPSSDYLPWIVGAASAILLLGLLIGYLRATPIEKKESLVLKYQDILKQRLADLEASYQRDELSNMDYELEKARLKSDLVKLTKQARK